MRYSTDPLSRSRLADLVSVLERGDTESVNLLLSLGVPPDVVDPSSGWSALHAAVLFKIELLPTLLEHSADPDPLAGAATPLAHVVHELAEKPDAGRRQALLDAIKLLLSAGADPRAGGPAQTAL